ncbi:MAG: adenosylcobinamide-GDP ribazoletransferase [Pseudomonadota bacterium]
MSFFRDYLWAIRSSTRVPVTGAFGQWIAPQDCAPPTSSAHQPGVGWLVGVVGCAAFAVLGLLLPVNPFSGFVAAVGSTMATALLTGGVNERGLARTAERAASLGSFALVLVVLAKLSLLAMLAARSPAAVLGVLLCGHVVSRFWPLLLGGRISRYTMLVAGAWCVAALTVCVFALGVGSAVAGLLLSAGAWWGMRKWLAANESATEETSTASTQQVCEIAFYLGAAIASTAR